MLTALMATTANATTVLMTFNSGVYTAYVNGVSYSGITAQAVTCTSASGGCSTATVDNTSNGLGITGQTSNEIADNDYVVLDFSSALKTTLNGIAGVTGITFDLFETNPGTSSANIVGTNTNPTSPSLESVNTINGTNVASSDLGISLNNNKTNYNLGTFTLSGSIDSYYVVDVTGNGCGVLIDSDTITTPTGVPEPGSFVLAGTALIGLGLGHKRRNRKA
jgi:hypothetical protein